jgi:hypothetical protein
MLRSAYGFMTFSVIAARLGIGAAGLALVTLAALHPLRPDIHAGRTMISQYALGRYGWLMTLSFAGFALASGCLFAALVAHPTSILSRIGLFFLLAAAFGLVMAARFPMDPVSTPRARMSFAGKMHGISFLVGVPSQLLAVLLLFLALDGSASQATVPLGALTSLIWLSLLTTIVIMLMVGPGKAPDPNGPERFLGLPNRLFMVAYGAWLMVAAWPLARLS